MRRIPLLLSAALVVATSASSVPAAASDVRDTRVVARLDAGGHSLLYKACHGAADDPSCSLDSGAASLPIEAPAAIDGAHAVFSSVRLGAAGGAGDRSALHVKIPLVGTPPDERAWEAVLVPGPSPVAAAGPTGWVRGEPGERSGVRVVELPASDTNGKPQLVVGEIHEERRICGQGETLIQPRTLDPATLSLRGVTLPRLSEEARASATRITAEATDPAALPAPLAPLLRATSTSAEGSASALTDGKTSTAWSEQRSGDGHGEFVTLAASPELPIDRLAFTLLPTAAASAATSAAADETAPHTVHLATGAHLYEVTFPARGARAARGDAFVVKLPEPIATGCLSLVLDRADGTSAHPVVTVAEVTAYGPFDGPGATADTVAKALDDDARGDGAVQELARLGDAGVRAAGARLPALKAQGQRRALTVAESGSCEAAAPLFVFELGRAGAAPEATARAERALRRCDRKAAPSLLAALQAPAAASASPASSVDIARVAAEVAPDEALPLLLHHVAVTAPDAPGESGYRDALAHAAERARSAAVVKALSSEPAVAAGAPSSPASLTLVRALGRRAAEIAPLATPIAVRAGRDPSAARRYLAVDPLIALAATAPEARATLASLQGDPAWTVRLRLAERADETPELLAWAQRAVDDPAPRVREAALASLARKNLAPSVVAVHAGDSEIWTFVRLAAISALESSRDQATRTDTDETLARATTEDASLEVRTAALDALALRAGPVAAKLVRQLLEREDLSAEVRAGAARAAGKLCLRDQADHLTELARPLTNVDASESARLVAVQALAALARLHPKDLGRRVAPFAASGVPAESLAAARQALAPTTERCPP